MVKLLENEGWKNREHRWSGWPGAWCLDCGCSDPREDAENDHNLRLSEDGMFVLDEGGYPIRYTVLLTDMICREPGSNRHNPYRKGDEKIDMPKNKFTGVGEDG